MNNNTCADSWCDGTYERGPKDGLFNLWQFGNNYHDSVYGKNNEVYDEYYQNNCTNTRLTWEATQETSDPIVTWGTMTDLNDTYVPRTALSHTFDWDSCVTLPNTSCTTFP